MSALPISKNQIYLIDDEFYQVVGDFSEVRTENDFQLENINNDKDKFQVSTKEARKNIRTGKWQLVDIE
jgi:hypothetical protein